jgi:putative transcriptional regulator
MEGKVRLTLDEMLKEMNLTRYALSKQTGIQYQTIDKYYKNKVVKYDSELLYKICSALKCEVGDIIKINHPDDLK